MIPYSLNIGYIYWKIFRAYNFSSFLQQSQNVKKFFLEFFKCYTVLFSMIFPSCSSGATYLQLDLSKNAEKSWKMHLLPMCLTGDNSCSTEQYNFKHSIFIMFLFGKYKKTHKDYSKKKLILRLSAQVAESIGDLHV